MARYAAEGAHVTLVTCTLGEEGEVLVPDLAHLAADRDDALGPHRIGELAAAMAELGVTDHRFLGGAGRYRDSGMDGTRPSQRPPSRRRVLAGRPREAADAPRRDHPRGAPAGTRHLRRDRRLRPPRPHPGPPGRDMRGRPWPPTLLRATSGEPWTCPRSTGTLCPAVVVEEASRRSREAGSTASSASTERRRLRHRGPRRRRHRRDRRHRPPRRQSWPRCAPTPPRSPSTARSSRSPNNLGQRSGAGEYYRLARACRGPVDAADGRETDLFAGVAAP